MTDSAVDADRPIAVSLGVADAALRARLAAILGATPGLRQAGEGDAAVMIADAMPQAADAPAVLVLVDGSTAQEAALRAGARGALPRRAEAGRIVAALAAIVAGLAVLPPGALAAPAVVAAEPVAALTPREREVLALLTAGAANKVIARRLGVSFHTAKAHVASVLSKLGASSRADAVARGVRAGLVLL